MAIPEQQLETWARQGATVPAQNAHTSIRSALASYDWPDYDDLGALSPEEQQAFNMSMTAEAEAEGIRQSIPDHKVNEALCQTGAKVADETAE